MKRILFVDGDAQFLQSLQFMLHPLREEWDMRFAENGQQAKQALLSEELDVLVTESTLPVIDSGAVLEFARECSPKTVRLVLSQHAEPQQALKFVGLAHQYLSKPCDAATLRKTISRVTEAGFTIRNERVMSLVAKLQHLPSLPSIYLQLVRLMNDPDASMDDVGTLIGADMAMTAKVLQLVNSSFFGLARNISKAADAATYLGINTLKTLVLAAGVFAQYERRTSRDFSASVAARHSQQVGGAARAIAECQGASEAVKDQALVAGQLHDIGKMILASNLPEEYQRVLRNSQVKPLEAERAVFGANHAEIGGYLLGLWGLPPAVVEAIGLHHSPAESGEQEFSTLTAVHVANSLVADQVALIPVARRAAIDTGYLSSLGLADRVPVWREAIKKFAA